MRERVLWVYWEMPPGVTELPPHIALCQRAMQRSARGYRLNFVTPKNLGSFLPDISPRIRKIALQPRGRIDRYFKIQTRRTAAIALRADYYRAFLLERFGGLYIDADAIVLGDLIPIFEQIEQSGFVITKRSSFGKSHVSVGFYGTVAGGKVIREYADALRARLAGSLHYDYNEVGASMLTPIVNRNDATVAILPEKIVQPVTFEEADEKFSSTQLNLSDVISPETITFMLYNEPFKRSLRGLNEAELLNSDRLISKVFRHALT